MIVDVFGNLFDHARRLSRSKNVEIQSPQGLREICAHVLLGRVSLREAEAG
jgi:hypothetical protein